jgi:hypothetical protein
MLNQMTTRIANIGASFLLFLLVACGEATSKQDTSKEDTTKENATKKTPTVSNAYTNTDWKTVDESAYSMQYPSEWELDQSGQMGTSLVLFSPLESGEDKFKENINVLIQSLTGRNIDLDKYTEISEEQVKTMLTNPVLIESKRMKAGTQEFHKVIYTADQGVFHLKFEQYYLVTADNAYILTLTCEQTKFDDFKETGENILNSFKLKN